VTTRLTKRVKDNGSTVEAGKPKSLIDQASSVIEPIRPDVAAEELEELRSGSSNNVNRLRNPVWDLERHGRQDVLDVTTLERSPPLETSRTRRVVARRDPHMNVDQMVRVTRSVLTDPHDWVAVPLTVNSVTWESEAANRL